MSDVSEPFVEIDLAALRWNFAQAQLLAGPGARLLPVIKSDAYGHGMVAAARELAQLSPWGFAVSGLEEALELRAAGINLPVLLLLGARPDEAAEAVRARLTPVVFDLAEAEALERAAAAERAAPLAVHVKIDTGMGRLGFAPRDLPAALPRLAALKNLEVEGVCSHLATADADDAYALEQLTRFQEALALFRRSGLNPRLNHLANSAATITTITGRCPDLGLMRPGIMLYGSYPAERMREKIELKPAMRLVARVLQVKELGAGQSVSYGRTYTATGAERVAVVGCGYSHGYSRALSGRGVALIRGRRAQVRGRVCMNALMVQADQAGVAAGDEVVLLGAQGEERIGAEELAELAGTISYELFCAMGRLCRRRFVNATAAPAEAVGAAARAVSRG